MSLIIITGQTATGKTKLALELAEKYNGELINFDSRQIYKYLNIITGKDLPKNSEAKDGFYLIPNPYSRQPIKLWLYDVATPDQYFSSFDFVKLVTPIIEDIKKRGKTPILVGGTYLYLKHLLYGFDDNNVQPNFELRKKLDTKSVKELQDILKKLSLESFNRLNHSDVNNPRRLIRRIEITSTNSDQFQRISTNLNQFHVNSFIGLKYQDKSKLRQVIEKRVGERLENGAIDEVKNILKMGYKSTDPGLKTIGYQQIIKYLNKELTKEKAIEDWINKEVQYAKRQLTFMKKDHNIKWREI
jgi:tRNA dimethylallyltransferase